FRTGTGRTSLEVGRWPSGNAWRPSAVNYGWFQVSNNPQTLTMFSQHCESARRRTRVYITGPYSSPAGAKEDSMATSKQRTRIRSLLLSVAALSMVFACSHLASAQTATTGQLIGQVTDPTGALVPQAKVEL